jgi:hypothetical protein
MSKELPSLIIIPSTIISTKTIKALLSTILFALRSKRDIGQMKLAGNPEDDMGRGRPSVTEMMVMAAIIYGVHAYAI